MFLPSLFLVLSAAYVAALESKLSQAQKEAILKVHNALRSSLALGIYTAQGNKLPSATNMKKLVWSEEIASDAQKAAEPCIKKHSKRDNDNAENWYAHSNYFEDIGKAAAEKWASEFQRFGLKNETLTREAKKNGIGHASQMAWANTEKLGCGLCDGKNSSHAMIFCQYYPAGNYIGSDIYNAGATCSKCEEIFVCEKKTGLCARK